MSRVQGFLFPDGILYKYQALRNQAERNTDGYAGKCDLSATADQCTLHPGYRTGDRDCERRVCDDPQSAHDPAIGYDTLRSLCPGALQSGLW